MIRSVTEQSAKNSSPSKILSAYLNAGITGMRQLILDAGQFRELGDLRCISYASRLLGMRPLASAS